MFCGHPFKGEEATPKQKVHPSTSWPHITIEKRKQQSMTILGRQKISENPTRNEDKWVWRHPLILPKNPIKNTSYSVVVPFVHCDAKILPLAFVYMVEKVSQNERFSTTHAMA